MSSGFFSIISENVEDFNPGDHGGNIPEWLDNRIDYVLKLLLVYASNMKPLREFIYSKDIAKISQWVLENYEGTDPLIISGDEEVSIKDLVDLLVQEFNFKGNVIFDSTKPDGQYKKPSDNSKIKELIPDFKYTSFEKGIKETVNWFIENYEKARK